MEGRAGKKEELSCCNTMKHSSRFKSLSCSECFLKQKTGYGEFFLPVVLLRAKTKSRFSNSKRDSDSVVLCALDPAVCGRCYVL